MRNYLDYKLDTQNSKEMYFRIDYQSPSIDLYFDYLARLGRNSFLTKVGYKIARGSFPEFKISKNTIFLRGSVKSMDRKNDRTRFYNNTTYRAGAEKMLKLALDEFVAEVKKTERAGLLSGYRTYTVYGESFRPERPAENPLAKMNQAGYGWNEYANPFYAPTPRTNVEEWLCTPYRTPQRPSYYNDKVTYISL